MIFKVVKKIIGMVLLGAGIGILLVLLLPTKGWLFLVGIAITALGFIWFCN